MSRRGLMMLAQEEPFDPNVIEWNPKKSFPNENFVILRHDSGGIIESTSEYLWLKSPLSPAWSSVGLGFNGDREIESVEYFLSTAPYSPFDDTEVGFRIPHLNGTANFIYIQRNGNSIFFQNSTKNVSISSSIAINKVTKIKMEYTDEFKLYFNDTLIYTNSYQGRAVSGKPLCYVMRGSRSGYAEVKLSRIRVTLKEES